MQKVCVLCILLHFVILGARDRAVRVLGQKETCVDLGCLVLLKIGPGVLPDAAFRAVPYAP
jgi:hypothetical protein